MIPAEGPRARNRIPLTQPAEVIGLTFRGRRLQRFRTPDGEREVRLTLDERRTESFSQLTNLPLWTAEGEKIPLASLAGFRRQPGPEEIDRENRLTSVRVAAHYEKGTIEDYLPQVKAALETMDFPDGYEYTFSEWEKRRQEQSREFLVDLLLDLLLVFAVMAGLFESVRQAVSLLVALPFALAPPALLPHPAAARPPPSLQRRAGPQLPPPLPGGGHGRAGPSPGRPPRGGRAEDGSRGTRGGAAT